MRKLIIAAAALLKEPMPIRRLPSACVAIMALFAGLAGCAEEDAVAPGTPVITDVSSQAIVVGETLEFFGHDILPEDIGDDARFTLRFAGDFETIDGDVLPVDYTIGAAYNAEEDGRQILTVRRFGPFNNPFTGDARIGTFRGEVTAIREEGDGLLVEGQPAPVHLEIEPSISIEMFQPMDAKCDAPAVRALAGLAYQMRVRVAGLKPTRYIYELNNINGQPGVTRIDHDFGPGNPIADDLLGFDEAILFNPIPEQQQSYVTAIRVIAVDDEGRTVETALPISVHRPFEVRYGGEYEIAELYEPEPVSGCIPGSIGSSVSYRETRTEYRQQSVSITIKQEWAQHNGTTRTQNWQEGISEGTSRSRSMGGTDREEERAQETYGVSYGTSEANSMNYSSTDGESWSWSRRESEGNTEYEDQLDRVYGSGSWSGTVGVEGSGSVPGFAKVTGKASTTVGVSAGASTAGTTGNRRRVSQDTGYSSSGSRDESRSFGTTTGESRSESLSGTYALSRARARSFEDTRSRSESRTYDFSEAASQAEVVSQGMSESEQRTWVSSSADQTVQAFTGFIPRSKVGIFYRQTTRWVRRAEVRGYNQCGLAEHMGELQFNEWTWAAELAIGDDCSSQPPASELPTAQCFIAPCGG